MTLGDLRFLLDVTFIIHALVGNYNKYRYAFKGPITILRARKIAHTVCKILKNLVHYFQVL